MVMTIPAVLIGPTGPKLAPAPFGAHLTCIPQHRRRPHGGPNPHLVVHGGRQQISIDAFPIHNVPRGPPALPPMTARHWPATVLGRAQGCMYSFVSVCPRQPRPAVSTSPDPKLPSAVLHTATYIPRSPPQAPSCRGLCRAIFIAPLLVHPSQRHPSLRPALACCPPPSSSRRHGHPP